MLTQNFKHTNTLLWCGFLAGPLYLLVSFIEILTRPGFDATRHSWSLLSNGELGWIHIANFIITGLLTILGAVGIRQVLKGEKAGTWGPLLLGLYGVGLIAAGIFVADPMDGFPVGTPVGSPTSISTSGMLHLVSGALGFIGLISACFVFFTRFKSLVEKDLAIFSLVTGILFLVGFIGIAGGSNVGGTTTMLVVLLFSIAVIFSWGWISYLYWHLMKKR